MSSIYGQRLKLSLFGQSHGPSVGMTLDGIPAGLPVDMATLQAFLDRRAPGKSDLTSPRREPDIPQFLGGIINGHTCGAPITAIISNRDVRPEDYDALRDRPRPGHADLTAQLKYGGYQDAAGGGHFSGRLTAPMCVAGGLCLQWLAGQGIRVAAKPVQIGKCQDPADFSREIEAARDLGDSVGGILECQITGLPAGLGEPIFGGMEGRISLILFGIPGIKGVEFGSGFAGSCTRGSENNDGFYRQGSHIFSRTNHAGGILGGITTGMPLIFRVAVKPTPSISCPQESVFYHDHRTEPLTIQGRHDPCIALRALPVVEAAAALAIFDAILCQKGAQLWN